MKQIVLLMLIQTEEIVLLMLIQNETNRFTNADTN